MGYIKSPWITAVRIEMERRNLNYQDVADGIGRSASTVSSVANGTLISRPTIAAISKFLGIPEDISEIHVTYS